MNLKELISKIYLDTQKQWELSHGKSLTDEQLKAIFCFENELLKNLIDKEK